jgi:hypothetical protein
MRRIYTKAPASYDYSYMTEVGTLSLGGGEHQFRILETNDYYRLDAFQIPRYMSGLYPAWTEEELERNFRNS